LYKLVYSGGVGQFQMQEDLLLVRGLLVLRK